MHACGMHNLFVTGNDKSELVFQRKNAFVNVTQGEPLRQLVRQTCNKSGYLGHRCASDVVLTTPICILFNWKVLLRNSKQTGAIRVHPIGNVENELNCVASE